MSEDLTPAEIYRRDLSAFFESPAGNHVLLTWIRECGLMGPLETRGANGQPLMAEEIWKAQGIREFVMNILVQCDVHLLDLRARRERSENYLIGMGRRAPNVKLAEGVRDG